MKRAVSWLAKLFVSCVVAVALVITLGIQQAQGTPYCCTGEVTSLSQPDEACIVEYTEKYPFKRAALKNESSELTTDLNIIYKREDDSKVFTGRIFIEPSQEEEVSLPPTLKQEFVLRDGGPVNFDCKLSAD